MEYHQKIESNAGAWGKATATVDAAAVSVLSWLWLFNAYSRILDHVSKNGNLIRKEILTESPHSKLGVGIIKFPGGVDNRVFANLWTWREEANGSFSLALGSLEDFHDQGSVAARTARSLLETDPGAIAATRAYTKGEASRERNDDEAQIGANNSAQSDRPRTAGLHDTCRASSTPGCYLMCSLCTSRTICVLTHFWS